MGRKPSAGRRGSWEWSRTAQTRQTMLRAAREVFTEHGFAEASISQVIERAGSSVGSLYHHFGGKTELFIAVWESFQDAQEEAAAASVAEARRDGVTDPLELFAVGSRTFLENAWRHRDLVRLFLHGDTPPGFELTRRARARGWVRQNAALLGAGDDPLSRLTVTVMSGLIGEAMWEVATSDDEAEASEVTDAALTIVRRFDFLANGTDAGSGTDAASGTDPGNAGDAANGTDTDTDTGNAANAANGTDTGNAANAANGTDTGHVADAGEPEA